MKKEYENPELVVLMLSQKDVVCASQDNDAPLGFGAGTDESGADWTPYK